MRYSFALRIPHSAFRTPHSALRTLLEANAHRADERVALDDLRCATKTVTLALADLLARA
jgi:acetylornithine deacetylase/succinyl-diaminopimelate desuccinylase-like protein